MDHVRSAAANRALVEELTATQTALQTSQTALRRAEEGAELWRRRAERCRGANLALQDELDRLRSDNRTLAEKLVEVASRPLPDPIVVPAPDITPILDQFRRTISPDITIPDRPDAPDEQRRGINWGDQGLDNSGGTPETVRDLFDVPNSPNSPLSIPDYVLDVESLTPNDVKGTRGGWYNPPATS